MSTTTAEYITMKELATWLRLSPSKIYELTSTKKIPHIKIGGKLLFNKAKIQDWIDNQQS